MGQRHRYQLQVVFIRRLYLMTELIMVNLYQWQRQTSKQENCFGIDFATSLGGLKISNSIANEKDANSNNTRDWYPIY